MSWRQGHSAIVCKYLNFCDKLNRNFRLPLVHIRLKQGEKSVRTDALVDVGSTDTFVPMDFMNMIEFNFDEQANQLGKKIKGYEKTEVTGGGGKFQCYVVCLNAIQVLKGTFVFCDFNNVTILVPCELDAIPYAVLGRNTIFRRYDVTFREQMEQIIFKPCKTNETFNRGAFKRK